MRELLTAEAIARLNGEFRWGVLDCYQFTAGVVFHVTGKDFRGLFDYQNERQAARLTVKAGGLSALVRGVLGESCPVSQCQNGDPVLVRAGREMLGVRFQGCAVVKTGKASKMLPLEAALYGWRL